MKRIFVLFLIALAFIPIVHSQNNIAIVNKIQGFYIFTDSQPIAEYDVIGEISTKGHDDSEIKSSGGQYQPVRDYLIKMARQTFFTADGLILNLVNGGWDKATVIKFKDNAENKNQARVSQFQGIYVFVDCEPLNKTAYLGTVKNKISLTSGQYTSLRDKLINKCRKEYDNIEGIIIRFVNGGTDTADAIKF